MQTFNFHFHLPFALYNDLDPKLIEYYKLNVGMNFFSASLTINSTKKQTAVYLIGRINNKYQIIGVSQYLVTFLF